MCVCLTLPHWVHLRVCGGEQTSVQAAATNPDFAVIGGDIAYANGWWPCYRKWDSWLNQWETNMVTPSGTMIPVMAAIGNHEASSFYGANPVTQVAFYSRYFAQALGLGAMDPALRPTYHAHPIGTNTILLSLDSNHVASPGGAQAAWLSSQLNSSLATYVLLGGCLRDRVAHGCCQWRIIGSPRFSGGFV